MTRFLFREKFDFILDLAVGFSLLSFFLALRFDGFCSLKFSFVFGKAVSNASERALGVTKTDGAADAELVKQDAL